MSYYYQLLLLHKKKLQWAIVLRMNTSILLRWFDTVQHKMNNKTCHLQNLMLDTKIMVETGLSCPL